MKKTLKLYSYKKLRNKFGITLCEEVAFAQTKKDMPLILLHEKEIKEIIENYSKYFPSIEKYKKWKQEEKALEHKY